MLRLALSRPYGRPLGRTDPTRPAPADGRRGSGLVEGDQAHAVLPDTLHRHEPTQLEPVTHEPLVVADERHRAGHAAHPEWDDEPAALGELVDPDGRDVGGLHGDDDADG